MRRRNDRPIITDKDIAIERALKLRVALAPECPSQSPPRFLVEKINVRTAVPAARAISKDRIHRFSGNSTLLDALPRMIGKSNVILPMVAEHPK